MNRIDGLIIAAAATLVAVLFPLAWGEAAPARRATVWFDGETVATVPLHRDRMIRVRGPVGESVVEVADGRARVARSPGRRQICVRAGWLSETGESAVCLPNRVVLTIAGGEPRFDAINF